MPALMRALAVLAAMLAATAVQAESFPSRPIRLVVPFAPGGPVDVGARLLAPKRQDALGVRVYVENVPGGSGNIGTAQVAHAAGDGTTVLVISSSLVVNSSLFRLTYDIEKDLAPVTLVGLGPQVYLVHPSVPAHSMKELIALIKANPGKYSYASAGTGTPGFLAGQMLKQAYGLDLVHVPFPGGAPAVTSTVGGHTPIIITTIPSIAGHARQGTLRALAVTSDHRSEVLPDVPTLAETGVPDEESNIILGVMVPGTTPNPIIGRLHDEIVKIIAQPEMKEKLAAVGFDPVGSTPEAFAALTRAEIAKWAKVIKDAGIQQQ
jgi:tripartite-type tricarboxylate transporter receptor subunit TctC